MTLREANEQLEKLENDYEYYLREKEELLSLVTPKSTDIRVEKVDGGKKEDNLSKYVELMDVKKIDETLDYIFKRKQNLLSWLDNELKILLKYGEVESVIVQLKENKMIKDKFTGKFRSLTWDEISKEVNWSKTFCRNVYRNYKRKRNID